jgi:hypothetical protein
MQYTPFASDIELPFYSALASLKINHDKLDDSARKVLGLYEVRPVDPPNASCRMQIHANALTSDEYVSNHLYPSLVPYSVKIYVKLTTISIITTQGAHNPLPRRRNHKECQHHRGVFKHRQSGNASAVRENGQSKSKMCYWLARLIPSHLDLGCHQRRHNLFLPFSPIFIHYPIIRGPEEVQVSLLVRIPCHSFRPLLGSRRGGG